MYLCTPRSVVIALDPVTGEERWRFDPNLADLSRELSTYTTCRGLSYHDAREAGWQISNERAPSPKQARALLEASMADVTLAAAGVAQNIVAGTAVAGAPNPDVAGEIGDQTPVRPDCLRRIFLPTRDARLIALSAETGTICPGFGGADGTVNLWQGMPNVSPSAYYSTSPPLVTDSVIVVGGGVNDNLSTELPSGAIRAFDLRTGALVWNFDPGTPDDTSPIAPGETYTSNVPNSWSLASYDAERDLVLLPLGMGSPDQYGTDRSEQVERLATSVIALDGATGALEWVFQTVHHDP